MSYRKREEPIMVTTLFSKTSALILWPGYSKQCHNHCFNLNWFWLHYCILSKELRFSSVQKNIVVVLHLKTIEFAFHAQKPEVVFHASSSWIRILFHTKNQLPRLPRTFMIVIIIVIGCGNILFHRITEHIKLQHSF